MILDEPTTAETTEQLVKAHILTVEQMPGGLSTQKLEEDWYGTPDHALLPPLSLDMLSTLSTFNSVRRSSVEAIALNTVGLGYQLGVEEGQDQAGADPKEKLNEARARLEACAGRDTRLEAPSFTTLVRAVKTDEEECGNGYLEVSRNKTTGRIDGVYHVPGRRVRRLKDRTGYLLLDPNGIEDDAVHFYNYGEKVERTSDNEPSAQLVSGKEWGTNELLAFKLYTSESRDYGLPRDCSMVLEYLGDKLAVESNVSFFDSSGTPPTVIFVQGEETHQGGRIDVKVPAQTTERIHATMKSDGGSRHRVAIVPLPTGVKADKMSLGEVSERDMGFTMYRDTNGRRTLASFRLQPIFVPAVPDSGRYSAEVQRSITLEQVFDPEQERYETKLTQTLLLDLGYPELRLTFKRLAVENDAAKRDSADKMAESGDITRREHRAAHGYPPLPEAAKGQDPSPGQVPFGWNDEVIQKAPPAGAQNRVVDGTGQQGLQPGLGGREQQSQPSEVVRGGARTPLQPVPPAGPPGQ